MKKHSHEEILSKLARADELARAGKSQADICKALGVSVMTLHRWRKLPPPKPQLVLSRDRAGEALSNLPTMDEMRRVLDELKLENQRLRKIVTDILLEKMRLEEATAVPSRKPGAQGVIEALLGPANLD
jgi:transposase-like protein